MNSLNFDFHSSGYEPKSYFDLEHHSDTTGFEHYTEGILGDSAEIGFSESEIKKLADEISDKLIVLVKNQLEK